MPKEITCPRCNSTYTPAVENPVKCARCSKVFVKGPTPAAK